jgi:ABC-type multidrug transport system fused ATPase/permease subunit
VNFAAIRASNQWKFFGVLMHSSRALAVAWWSVLALRGLLPALFAIAMGALVGAVQSGASLAAPLALMGTVFLLLQVLAPLHRAIGANLGSQTAAWLYDELTTACVSPPGMGHLEDSRITTDLTMARDFDLGITGPPLAISMDFIASGMVEMVGGLASAAVLAAYAWWAPLLLAGAWLATHWLLRESAVWKDRNTAPVREAQRHADYAYRLAVDAPSAKELRLFGLAGWIVDRFTTQRRRLLDLQWQATRLRERPVLWSLLVVLSANLIVFWRLAEDTAAGRLSFARMVTFVSAASVTSMIAFGGLSWALDGASSPAGAVLRLRETMSRAGALVVGTHEARNTPAREIRFHNVRFSYPGAAQPVLDHFDLTIPAGSSLAIVGQNGAGKTTLAKLLCRLYDPQEGGIEIDGVDLRALNVEAWRARLTAVFQDFIRFELPLRDNVAPSGAPSDNHDAVIQAALVEAGATQLASLDTILSRAYQGGTDLSGGQWQRVALARALCGVKMGAGIVLLDEPTAQLDVRGEAEIFERILAATRQVTTILISHRFSTVRHADRICVLEHGRVVELGSHDELMAAGGRYRTMFDLQASRFGAGEEGVELDVLA